jgi:hypothetical protein
MTQAFHSANSLRAVFLAACCLLSPVFIFAASAPAGELLPRVQDGVSDYLEQFSEVKCTEKVKQEKLKPDSKVELQHDATYDYLVILTNIGGEISLDESRLAIGDSKADKKNRPLLVSNGFATLFLIFHPYYAERPLLPDNFLPASSRNSVSRCPVPARPGISPGNLRNGMD